MAQQVSGGVKILAIVGGVLILVLLVYYMFF
jgi:hypothetical protein